MGMGMNIGLFSWLEEGRRGRRGKREKKQERPE